MTTAVLFQMSFVYVATSIRTCARAHWAIATCPTTRISSSLSPKVCIDVLLFPERLCGVFNHQLSRGFSLLSHLFVIKDAALHFVCHLHTPVWLPTSCTLCSEVWGNQLCPSCHRVPKVMVSLAWPQSWVPCTDSYAMKWVIGICVCMLSVWCIVISGVHNE